jgi:LmbE family N-acetylglucosaminyl deacetylase
VTAGEGDGAEPGPLIHGRGTPEQTWRAWRAMGAWPVIGVDAVIAGEGGARPLVVAAHPDDEVLGAGGLLARIGDAEIVAVTDGEASHPGSLAVDRGELAARRRRETEEALRRLGVGRPVVHRLGQPDGAVDEVALTGVLCELLGPDRWCVATWRLDGHPDHEAVGRAAARACRARGARLLEYPVWTWHWARPGDERVPWQRCRRLPLSPAEQAAKRDAVAAFESQIRPLGPDPADAAVLPPEVLARFDRPFEVFFG